MGSFSYAELHRRTLEREGRTLFCCAEDITGTSPPDRSSPVHGRGRGRQHGQSGVPRRDIVEALNDMPPELAVAVLLHLPPDRAIEVLDQPGLEREPELVTLMPMRPSIAPRASPLGISRSDGRA
jgi:hypothetical protein